MARKDPGKESLVKSICQKSLVKDSLLKENKKDIEMSKLSVPKKFGQANCLVGALQKAFL